MSVNPKKVREILDKNILADGFEPIIDLDKSHGSCIVDQRNGKELLDMYCKGVYKRFPDDIAIEKIMNDGRRFV